MSSASLPKTSGSEVLHEVKPKMSQIQISPSQAQIQPRASQAQIQPRGSQAQLVVPSQLIHETVKVAQPSEQCCESAKMLSRPQQQIQNAQQNLPAQISPSQTVIVAEPKKKGLNAGQYEELIGRLMTRKGVRGVAVTSGDGQIVFHNDSIPNEVLEVYVEIISNIEYLCTVAARESDPNSRWQYVRFETDEYEMMVTIASTHWVFLLAEPQEDYNGEKEFTANL